jgi:hypothetical protein
MKVLIILRQGVNKPELVAVSYVNDDEVGTVKCLVAHPTYELGYEVHFVTPDSWRDTVSYLESEIIDDEDEEDNE